jgi:hypothetical protein
MTAVAILAVFFVFAVLMYLRRMPALLAVPLMAVTMALVAGVPAAQIANDVVVAGSVSLAKVIIAVIFGAMLGRVTMDTGIARALVNLAAEYGGENPLALALVLCAVVALLFVSLSGLGTIIMVGSIVLPIMMTTGVPRKAAATLFLMAFALGFIFNITNWTFYTKLFGVERSQLTGFAIVLAVIDAAALLVYAVAAMRHERGYATWAKPAEEPTGEPRIGWWALFTPVLPIALYFVFHLDAVPAFAVAAVYGVLATKPRKAVEVLVASAIRGVEDAAPAIVLFIGIGMLFSLSQLPAFVHALEPLVRGGWVRNPIAFVVIFGLLSPLTLYRGPLNPFGVGIAVFTVLLTTGALPPIVLVAAIMAVVQVQNVCDPTNTQNVWVGNFTGTPIDEITKRTLPYQVAVATLACIAIVVAGPALLGVRPFALEMSPALAQTSSPSGLFAPISAADRVVVDDDGSALARAAADTTTDALNATKSLRATRRRLDPTHEDCTGKWYVAYIGVTSTVFKLREGTDLDIGVTLDDCGGWEVSEWHDHAVFPNPPTGADARRLAAQGFARLQDWAAAHPEQAAHLWRQGLAYAPGDPPTYFYALFKTVDGNMRVFVRAGGPAYASGLRTNDVVDKLDGKFWWEYGTYQTQQRAYDGKPHSFEVERGGRTLELQLGEPFVASLPSG